MLTVEQVRSFLIIDIETVRQFPNIETLKNSNEALYKIWLKKTRKYFNESEYKEYLQNFELQDQKYKKDANLHPEFAKIVSISFTNLKLNDKNELEINEPITYTDDDEKMLLSKFIKFLTRFEEKLQNNRVQLNLCGHNIISFDIPFIIKRLIINKIKTPRIFHIHNQKPWECPFFDTLRFWKFGSSESTSLELLCNVLGVESSKEGEVTGETLGDYYWHNKITNNLDHALQTISKYCQEDVVATAKLIVEISKM